MGILKPIMSLVQTRRGALGLESLGFSQLETEVFVRKPGTRAYETGDLRAIARALLDYAVMSHNVYHEPDHNPERMALPGWRLRTDFPSGATAAEVKASSMAVEVWERTGSPEVCIAFRGTDGVGDWKSNLRWVTRFIPFFKDQYTVVSEHLGFAFADWLVAEFGLASARMRITATGHSLGGGLAQHFAYSLPRGAASGESIPRIATVFAFDPSPVTGWSSVRDHALRAANVANLSIKRVFEHGEVLAYARLLMSYIVPPSAKSPAVEELRFNFNRGGLVSDHKIGIIADGLKRAAG